MTGPILNSTRKMLGLTMAELNKQTGIADATIHRLETGKLPFTKQRRAYLTEKLRALCLKRAGQLQKRAEELR